MCCDCCESVTDLCLEGGKSTQRLAIFLILIITGLDFFTDYAYTELNEIVQDSNTNVLAGIGVSALMFITLALETIYVQVRSFWIATVMILFICINDVAEFVLFVFIKTDVAQITFLELMQQEPFTIGVLVAAIVEVIFLAIWHLSFYRLSAANTSKEDFLSEDSRKFPIWLVVVTSMMTAAFSSVVTILPYFSVSARDALSGGEATRRYVNVGSRTSAIAVLAASSFAELSFDMAEILLIKDDPQSGESDMFGGSDISAPQCGSCLGSTYERRKACWLAIILIFGNIAIILSASYFLGRDFLSGLSDNTTNIVFLSLAGAALITAIICSLLIYYCSRKNEDVEANEDYVMSSKGDSDYYF